MIERSRVRVLAGAAGEFSSPGSTYCADSFRYPVHPRVTAVAPKSADGRLQQVTPYLCSFIVLVFCLFCFGLNKSLFETKHVALNEVTL